MNHSSLPLHRLYSDHHGWLRAWLRRRLGCPEQAADLAHDTFLRVLAGTGATPLHEPRAFLTTVAQRTLANHFRRLSIERAYLAALNKLPEREQPSAEVRAIWLETLVDVDRLLGGLPAAVRSAFFMSQLDGRSHADIAAALNVSVATVKRYIIRAGHLCYFAADGAAS